MQAWRKVREAPRIGGWSLIAGLLSSLFHVKQRAYKLRRFLAGPGLEFVISHIFPAALARPF
jgi:hypothetical protein